MRTFAMRPLLVAAAAILTALYHWRFTSWGLGAGFTFDDLMNLGRTLDVPVSQMIVETIAFFRPSQVYRPVGELWYRLIYEAAGPWPEVFRWAFQILLILDIAVAWWFFRKAGATLAVAAIAALPVAHHYQLSEFSYNSGFIFDVLCFLFYLLAAGFYLRRRSEGELLSGKDLVLMLGLFVLALGSKELAVTLPAVLLAVELTFPGPWPPRRFAPIVLAGVIALAFLAGRVYSPEGLAGVGGYRTAYTWEQFQSNGARLVGWFFYQKGPSLAATGVFVFVTVCALVTRDRVPRIGLILAILGVLPVIFLDDRGLPASFVPFAGLTLACAWCIEAIFRKVIRRPAAGVLAFLCLYWLLWTKSDKLELQPQAALRENVRVTTAMDSIRALGMNPPPHSRLLMLTDPFPESRWSSTFAWRIVTGDPTIMVEWPEERPDVPQSEFYAVLTTENGRIVRVTH